MGGVSTCCTPSFGRVLSSRTNLVVAPPDIFRRGDKAERIGLFLGSLLLIGMATRRPVPSRPVARTEVVIPDLKEVAR